MNKKIFEDLCILLIEIKPSLYGGGYYKLHNKKITPVALEYALENKSLLKGWYITVTTWRFKKESLAFFIYHDDILMFDGHKFISVTPFSFTKTCFTLWKTVSFYLNGRQIKTIHYFTPPVRYLLSDGMFPDAIEPLDYILDKFATIDAYQDLKRFFKKLGVIFKS